MKDRYGRTIDYMRISITERCNYRCFYCMPQDLEGEAAGEVPISASEIIEVAKAGARLGIRKVRVTGGEPLIRGDIGEILKGLSKIEGIEELCITTNGSLLDEKLELLRESGVSRINVSLDTLDGEKFQRITRYGKFSQVWRGVERALGAGIEVRINSVIVEGINDDEIGDLAAVTEKYPVDIRFIELMPIGEGRRYRGVSGEEVRRRLAQCGRGMTPLKRDGASEYYRIDGAMGRIGFINPVSSCFCEECNRIRVTSQGEIKQCLNKRAGVNIREIGKTPKREEELALVVAQEIYNKPEKHLFNIQNECEDNNNMNQIGG